MTTTLQSNLTRPLALKQGASEVSILVPSDVWVAAEQLREAFLISSEASPAGETIEDAAADDQAPEMALVARFLKFATDKSEQVMSFAPCSFFNDAFYWLDAGSMGLMVVVIMITIIEKNADHINYGR